MSTIRYYAVTPEVADSLRNDPDFRVWPGAQATDSGQPRAATAAASFVVVTARNGKQPGGTLLGATVKDPPTDPPLAGAGESIESYQRRLENRVELVRDFAG